MELFRPYLVMLGIAIVFFFVCWMVFREKKSVSREIINHSNNQKPNSIMMIFKGYLKKWVISKS